MPMIAIMIVTGKQPMSVLLRGCVRTCIIVARGWVERRLRCDLPILGSNGLESAL